MKESDITYNTPTLSRLDFTRSYIDDSKENLLLLEWNERNNII
jgi:hypothetical protein